MPNSDLARALVEARKRKRWSIRKLAEEAGVSTATVVRYEAGAETVQPRTLDRITAALGVASAVPVTGSRSEWTIPAGDDQIAADHPQGSSSVVTDGRSVVVLEIPPGFLDGLSPEALAEIEQDALLEVLRLARAAKRGTSDATRDSTRGS